MKKSIQAAATGKPKSIGFVKTKFFLFLFFFCLISNLVPAQIIQDKGRLNDIGKMLRIQKKFIKLPKGKTWKSYINSLSKEEAQGMSFLYAYMPLSDLADYDIGFFLKSTKATLMARNEMEWSKKIPEELFLHYVLPIRVNNENLDSFRYIMYDELKNRVKGLTMTEAALEINHWCHEKVTYQGSDERTSSPLTTMNYSFGRCGEESVFTVAALRTVGIPARQVYTPRWAHQDDNHAWVEIWIDGTWHFLGACEPDACLDRGWFSYPATRAMLVHTRAFGKYLGNEELITDEKRFGELNVINEYSETKRIFVKAIDDKGIPVRDANIDFCLYNYAEFYPIAKKKTNEKGIVYLTTGLGDLLIWASKGSSFGYQFIHVAESDTLEIVLKKRDLNGISIKTNLVPPKGNQAGIEAKKEDEASMEANNRRLKREDSIRAVYTKTFWNEDQVRIFSKENVYDFASLKKYLIGSYGNWKEISAFLHQSPEDKKCWAVRILRVISEKDLRDASAAVLLDHLLHSDYTLSADTTFFTNYILNPRIGNEKLVDWRLFLKEAVGNKLLGEFRSNPDKMVQWVNSNIKLDDVSNLHSRAPLSPKGVFRCKMADSRSKDIFFVALCRTCGIASRLNPETQVPQYFDKNQWINVWFDHKKPEGNAAYGSILFIDSANSIEGKYFSNFTIARLQNGRYHSLQFDEGKSLSDFKKEEVKVLAGDYMLVTGNRQQDGSVLCFVHFFKVIENQSSKLIVNIRNPDSLGTVHGNVDLKDLHVTNAFGKENIDLSGDMKKNALLFVFIEPDKEPTKHVLKDLQNIKKEMDNWGIEQVFVFKDGLLPENFNEQSYQNLPEKHIFAFDSKNELYNRIIQNLKNTGMKDYPLLYLLRGDGSVVYVSTGYKIGIDEEIKKVMLIQNGCKN
jgi:transglutaminase-like putative cysteine protease